VDHLWVVKYTQYPYREASHGKTDRRRDHGACLEGPGR
jgi:hypothetical protein